MSVLWRETVTQADMKLRQFWWCVGYYAANHPEERRGQATFNVLYRIRPDLSERIRGTALDAFYKNERLDAMCLFIEEEW